MPNSRWQAIIFMPYYSKTTLIYAPVGKLIVNIHIFTNAYCVIFKDLTNVRNLGIQTDPSVNCSILTVCQFTDQSITTPNVLCNAQDLSYNTWVRIVTEMWARRSRV